MELFTFVNGTLSLSPALASLLTAYGIFLGIFFLITLCIIGFVFFQVFRRFQKHERSSFGRRR